MLQFFGSVGVLTRLWVFALCTPLIMRILFSLLYKAVNAKWAVKEKWRAPSQKFIDRSNSDCSVSFSIATATSKTVLLTLAVSSGVHFEFVHVYIRVFSPDTCAIIPADMAASNHRWVQNTNYYDLQKLRKNAKFSISFSYVYLKFILTYTVKIFIDFYMWFTKAIL